MSTILPFQISFPANAISVLKQKLKLSTFPHSVPTSSSWSRGPPIPVIRELANYWGEEFDWLKAEKWLNTIPQFMTSIPVKEFGEFEIHFIHQKSKVENAIPLLYVHGWPGSCFEVLKMLGALVGGEGEGPAFHVVALDLVGFGYSEACLKEGFGVDQQAEVCHELMLRLGYDEYVVQGGDIGYMVARFMALKYGGKHCKALLLTNAAPAEPTQDSFPELYAKMKAIPLSESELEGFARSAWFDAEGSGYYKQQSTKPLTLGYSLNDSPIGLLAWIYEKLHDWTNNYVWETDEILTWVSIYWFSTAGAAASLDVFYENEHRNPPALKACQAYSDVPLGISRFENDLILLPKLWNHTMGPVVFESVHERGSHLSAWECPEVLVEDLRRMFGRGGGAYGCVTGKNGYSH